MKNLVLVLLFFASQFAYGHDQKFCEIEPLPPVEDRTDFFWVQYLNNALHRCFDYLSPRVKDSAVELGGSFPAYTRCEASKNHCVVLMDPHFLKLAQDPNLIMPVLGHEAAHVLLLLDKDLSFMGSDESEYASDFLGSERIYMGACHAVKSLELSYDNTPEDTPDGRHARDALARRRLVMLAKCATYVASEKARLFE